MFHFKALLCPESRGYFLHLPYNRLRLHCKENLLCLSGTFLVGMAYCSPVPDAGKCPAELQ